MIRLIQGIDRASHSFEIDRMHTIRRQVFHDRLGWDVKLDDGWEIDEFDDCNPLYLLSIDPETDDVRGSVRLLPTTGPNMLRDVFSNLLEPGMEVASGLIWESSRFSVDPEYACAAERNSCQINQLTAELLLGMAEVGKLIGLSHIVSVYDAMMARIFRRAGCQAETIGRPQRFGKVMAYAGLFATDDEMINALRAAGGISGSVLEKPAPTDPLAALL
ncbi:acyl-homoserine-lactone synthase [Breoghania sp. JC706]|uniref:acyl-homoserine-lactone synthase n=1 Tax=Breoghania sp. JC706 TaxID=3117732 RepID=UPI00300B0A37